jgi:hypothetical protein
MWYEGINTTYPTKSHIFTIFTCCFYTWIKLRTSTPDTSSPLVGGMVLILTPALRERSGFMPGTLGIKAGN